MAEVLRYVPQGHFLRAHSHAQRGNERGKGLCGIYPYEIAETKAEAVRKQARKEGYPMRCSVEEQ